MKVPVSAHVSVTDDEHLDFDADNHLELLAQAKLVVESLHSYGEQDQKLLKDAHDMLRSLAIIVLADVRRKKERKW